MGEERNKKIDEAELLNNDVLAELILKEITSNKSVLAMLFDYETMEEVTASKLGKRFNGDKVIDCIKRVINTAFLIALSRWKQVYDDKEWQGAEFEMFRNSRYSRLFLSALTYEDITLDMQVFALIELWVSLNASPRVIFSKFEGFFSVRDGESIGILLQQALDVAKNATFMGTSNTKGKYSKLACNVLLYRLLKALRIFRSVEFTLPQSDDLGDGDFTMRYSTYEEDVELVPNELFVPVNFVVSYAQLAKMKGNPFSFQTQLVSPYMLVGISAFDNKKQFVYCSFDGEQQTRVEDEKSKLSSDEKASSNIESSKDIIELRKFLCFNYKNIREFALVISDAVRSDNSLDTQKILYETCKNRYPQIVAKIPSYTSKDIYWDNLITLMLVEMGPSDFLELILNNGSLYDKIMENVGWRCIGHRSEVDLRANYNRDKAEIESQCGRNKHQANKRIRDLRVTYVVRAMGFYETEENEFNPFEESLSAKYDNMILCLESLKQYAGENVKTKECLTSKNTLVDILKNMFIFLQMFYEGLDAFADKKLSTGDKGEISSERRHQIHKDLNDVFTEAAAHTYIKVKELSLTQNYEAFCKLCEEYNNDGGNGFNVSDRAIRLKFLITRNYICDVSKLKHFVTIKLQNGKESTIFHMLENFTDEYWGDPAYTQWLTYFKDFFLFLIYNDDYYERGLYDSDNGELIDKDCDPVYPYLVNYYRENKDRDNLKKCCYRVPIPVNGASGEEHDKGMMVTLLTDEDFPAVTHFCIPLRYGSTDNWWINPFMIPAKGFMSHLKMQIKKITGNIDKK